MKNISVKDYTVSGEVFELRYDLDLEMYKTFPQPSVDKLPSYYKSEDYISHTNTKRNLFEKAYHWVRSYMLSKKISFVEKHNNTTTKKLLDIGCGTGDFLKIAKERTWEISGIEPNAEARKIAAEKTGIPINDNAYFDEIPDAGFDVITMWHVLEHVPDLETQIATLKRIIKPDGTIFIAVPNYKSYDAHYYKEQWAAYDVPRHLWHFSQRSIKSLFSKENLKVVKILPMKFDAYYVSLLSEKYKTGSMRPFQAWYRGFLSNWKARRSSEYSSLIYIIKNEQ